MVLLLIMHPVKYSRRGRTEILFRINEGQQRVRKRWIVTVRRPLDGWLGSGTDEDRAKLRYASGRRKEP